MSEFPPLGPCRVTKHQIPKKDIRKIIDSGNQSSVTRSQNGESLYKHSGDRLMTMTMNGEVTLMSAFLILQKTVLACRILRNLPRPVGRQTKVFLYRQDCTISYWYFLKENAKNRQLAPIQLPAKGRSLADLNSRQSKTIVGTYLLTKHKNQTKKLPSFHKIFGFASKTEWRSAKTT